MKKIISALTLCLVLTGCGDVKEASEKNFEISIQRFLDAGFPACVINQNFPAIDEGFSFGNNFKIFEEMAKIGLLTKTEETKQPANKYAKPKQVTIYNLTEEGKKYYQISGKNLRDEDLHGFCFGKADITEIVDFTQPSDMFGKTVSDVNFKFTVSGLPEWAKKPEITSLNEQIKKLVEASESPIKGEAKMVLTNKGWKHIQQDSLDERKLNKK